LASFQGGLDELTSALAQALGNDLRLQARVLTIDHTTSGFEVAFADHDTTQTIAAGAVALAMPAHAASGVVARLDSGAAETLMRIPYVPVTLVHLGYAASSLSRPLDAYGFFVPPSESLQVLGGIFPSRLFVGRAPPGCQLLSIRTGGARHPEAFAMPDQELRALAEGELGQLLGLGGPSAFVHVVRHERALPQYTLGHLGRVAALEEAERRHPGLFFHGNAYHNAGVPELVLRSGQLAKRMAPLAQANG
jgi:oxygen-dependent protoporphyrinogen oxidase